MSIIAIFISKDNIVETMKRLSKKKRYWIWGGIWLILFAFSIRFLLPYYAWEFPFALFAILVLAFIKDTADHYNINNGKDSFLHPHFEHAPLMFILAVYSMYNLVSTKDFRWIFFTIGFIVDLKIDWEQDKICCIE